VGHLEADGWPPHPIKTERLVLREPEPVDRATVIELFTSPEVGTYVGGPRPRAELERDPGEPRRRPGLFIVALNGAMIGFVTLDRREAQTRGHIRPEGGEAELAYMFVPEAWGHGYATEACAAALGWFFGAHAGEPVVLCAQVANGASVRVAERLGFTEVERFQDYGAEQWFGVCAPAARLEWLAETNNSAVRGSAASGDGYRPRSAGRA